MKLQEKEIMLINALDNQAGVSAKDCLSENNQVTFLVKENEVGRAIGKDGANIKYLSNKIKKNIEIIPYYDKPELFLKKNMKNVKFNAIQYNKTKNQGIIFIELDNENKKKLQQENNKLKKIKVLLERNYEIKSIKIK